MQVSNSVLPPDALAGVRMSSSKSTNRIEKPASSSTSGETFVPQFVYTPQLGWTPVNPHALMQLQAQGGYLQHLAESAMQGVAQVRYPFPTSHTIQDDLYTAAHQHAQAMHIAEVQQPVPPQQLKPTVSVSEPSGHSKSAAKPASGRKDPFVYVNPSEQVLLEIRRRALFVAPMYRPRQRVAQACEACRKRKIKCTGTKPKCKRCINRSIDCVYAPENRGTKVSKTERSLPLVSLQNLKLQEDHGDSMDASPTDNSVLAPNSGAAIGPLSLEISPPYYPQFLATRSLSAPAQGPTHMVDYAAVRQDHRAHAQGFSLPGPSQPPASYFYSHASSLQPPAYAAQQAEYTGLPSPQNSSPYYNYLQPPVMQQRSQSHPAHYTASGHYSQ
ncbi:hypothetical protein L226DRAFT_199579 [Lentinus tigrinus ALCF2SS1-7]|uniref:uncharacterized protein n=1 Tax=Lentinus tigrinus ALCF2SS1-7 TaxID=1328758 RepID=UPI0011663F3F|nr:hypothetical protein L226DRAFT_199579 [Lentinus tigrinus ALCF2SS1-7]